MSDALNYFFKNTKRNLDVLPTDGQANAVGNRQNTDVNGKRHVPVVLLNHHLKIVCYSGKTIDNVFFGNIE